MTRRYCDTGRTECPHLPECVWECHYDNATVARRKIKAYPIVPVDVDLEPVPEVWHTISAFLIAGAMAMLVIFFAMVFFTGLYIWGLLI